MTEKHPMQADGDGKESDEKSDELVKNGPGESGGGPYPNPHSGEERGDFDGGQSGKSYSGPDNPNATTD